MPDKWNLEGVAVDTENNMTLSAGLTVAGVIVNIANLPTSDPSVAGQLWSNSNVVTVSAG